MKINRVLQFFLYGNKPIIKDSLLTPQTLNLETNKDFDKSVTDNKAICFVYLL